MHVGPRGQCWASTSAVCGTSRRAMANSGRELPADRARTIACARRAAASTAAGWSKLPVRRIHPFGILRRDRRAPAVRAASRGVPEQRIAQSACSEVHSLPRTSAKYWRTCLATPGHRRACRSAAPPRPRLGPEPGFLGIRKRAGTVALVAFEHRVPAGDVDLPLRLGVVGAVAQPADRFDALGLRVHAHQRVGHLDRGAAVPMSSRCTPPAPARVRGQRRPDPSSPS